MKRPYWLDVPERDEISALIERRPIFYGCPVEYLQFLASLVRDRHQNGVEGRAV